MKSAEKSVEEKVLYPELTINEGQALQIPSITLIIPAFNEEKTIGKVISETNSVMEKLGLPWETIVVDDCSSDETAKVASGYNVVVLLNSKNKGKGYCLRKALHCSKGDIIVMMDSDGEHDPAHIPTLIEPILEGTDIVAGSRFLGGQGFTSKLNLIGNQFFNFVIMTLTGKYVTDSQTGFRALKRDVVEKLNLVSDGYEIETEITVKSLSNGFSFMELPIKVRRRQYGRSKIKLFSDGKKIISTILKASLSEIKH